MGFEHVDEFLSEFLLGSLPESERAAVQAHLRDCGRCGEQLASTADVLAEVMLAGPGTDGPGEALMPVAPAASVRARLMTRVAQGGRFARFTAEVMRLLDLTAEKAAALLDRLDAPEAWAPLPVPGVTGIELFVPETGPRLRDATVGFLRLKPGARFPTHRHLGYEEVLTLQGGYRDDIDGKEWGPGDLQKMHVDTSHSFVGVEGPDCICLGVVLGRIAVEGLPDLL